MWRSRSKCSATMWIHLRKKKRRTNAPCAGTSTGSTRGVAIWSWGPSYPGGAVQGKAADSTMAKEMRLTARMGHPCGQDFLAKPFLEAHPEFAYQEPYLHDMKAGPWTTFSSNEAAPGQK